MSCSTNCITLMMLCTRTPLVLCCDQFDRGSNQVKRDLVDLAIVGYMTLHFADELWYMFAERLLILNSYSVGVV